MTSPVLDPWDDVALSQAELEQVAYLIARIRGRRPGTGVSALLSGPAGTGTTLIAALIANELGLALHRVDCARAIASEGGDAERELSAAFAATDVARAILLVDHADVVASRGVDSRAARWLLERLDTFTGILMLSTLDASRLDPAILRRLSPHVRFASRRTL